MNQLNHFIFATSLYLIFIELNIINLFYIVLFSLIFTVLIDYDHKFLRKKAWYNQRTWIQEPFGFIFIGIPLAFLLSLINRIYFVLVITPYLSHIFLDYLCVFEAHPLAPFSKLKKSEGFGVFIPDNLFGSKNSKKWAKRVKLKKIRGISENYFTIFNLILFITIILSNFI